VIELYEKLIKRRASIAKDQFDDKKDLYVLSLLRYFREKYFSALTEEKESEKMALTKIFM